MYCDTYIDGSEYCPISTLEGVYINKIPELSCVITYICYALHVPARLLVVGVVSCSIWFSERKYHLTLH